MSEINNENKITVLIVEPEKAPYVKEISGELESLQKIVGGFRRSIPSTTPSPSFVTRKENYKACPLTVLSATKTAIFTTSSPERYHRKTDGG